jgi:hypothetical protein
MESVVLFRPVIMDESLSILATMQRILDELYIARPSSA